MGGFPLTSLSVWRFKTEIIQTFSRKKSTAQLILHKKVWCRYRLYNKESVARERYVYKNILYQAWEMFSNVIVPLYLETGSAEGAFWKE